MLLAGYRDAVMPRWRMCWWPVSVLLQLRARAELTRELGAIAAAIDAARTLPLPVADVARALLADAHRYPGELHVTDRLDAVLEVREIEVVPPPGEPRRDPASTQAATRQIADVFRRHRLDLSGSRLLEIGPGEGRVAFGLAAATGASIVGVDPEAARYEPALERARVPEETRATVDLRVGNVHALEFEDASFDGVFSTSALEHVRDVGAALAETYRVLRPGGIAYHGVDGWFGPRGGHSLCTLDFPWGHLRLDLAELEDYGRRWRPLEADDAVGFRAHAIQEPQLTQREFRAAARSAGFQVVEFRSVPLPLADPHWRFLDRATLADCRVHTPAAEPADLLSIGYAAVLRRR